MRSESDAIHLGHVPALQWPRRTWSARGKGQRILLLGLVLACTLGSSAQAQTWAGTHKRPSLFQIISVDTTGESGWRYGSEDVAGDGLVTFDLPETTLDLRTTYAAADAERVWVRSYVSASARPPATSVVVFFFDTDSNPDTGGSAAREEVWPFSRAVSSAGYEQAIGIRGDGTVLGHYRWNAKSSKFVSESDPMNALAAEFGAARDPIGFGGAEHGYAQLSIAHGSSGLDINCRARIFVRIWNDVPSGAFGDDDIAPAACVPRENAYGDPEVLASDRCDADSDCPAQGRCRDHVCLFAYECEASTDCRSEERCEGRVCVRSVDGQCESDAQCDGLVCESRACVACATSGARACEDGRLCTPGGACIAPGAASSAANTDTNSDDGGVRGGAFRCNAGAGASAAPAGVLLGLMLGLAAVRRKRRRRRGALPSEQRAASERTGGAS